MINILSHITKYLDCAEKRISTDQQCLLIKTCSFCDIIIVNCKQTSSKHAPDPLIARELHKKSIYIPPPTVSIQLVTSITLCIMKVQNLIYFVYLHLLYFLFLFINCSAL